jgi:hypothetical protein
MTVQAGRPVEKCYIQYAIQIYEQGKRAYPLYDQLGTAEIFQLVKKFRHYSPTFPVFAFHIIVYHNDGKNASRCAFYHRSFTECFHFRLFLLFPPEGTAEFRYSCRTGYSPKNSIYSLSGSLLFVNQLLPLFEHLLLFLCLIFTNL